MEAMTKMMMKRSLIGLLITTWSVTVFASACAGSSTDPLQERPGFLLATRVMDRLDSPVFVDRIALSVPAREPAPVDYGRYPEPAAAALSFAAPEEQTTVRAPLQVTRAFRHK